MNAPVHPTTFAALTTRQLLEAQRDQLAAAIAVGTDPFDRNIARRLHNRAIVWLGMTDKALDAARGLIGKNGWQPGVDHVCASLLASAGERQFGTELAGLCDMLEHRFTTPVATPIGTLFEDAGL